MRTDIVIQHGLNYIKSKIYGKLEVQLKKSKVERPKRTLTKIHNSNIKQCHFKLKKKYIKKKPNIINNTLKGMGKDSNLISPCLLLSLY